MGLAIIYEDNMSIIELVKNGKSNSDKTRHIAIRYFFISDRIMNKEISVNYMPTATEDMIADILTKLLQGTLFKRQVVELELDRYPFYYVAAVTLSHPSRDVFYNVSRYSIIEMFTIESN